MLFSIAEFKEIIENLDNTTIKNFTDTAVTFDKKGIIYRLTLNKGKEHLTDYNFKLSLSWKPREFDKKNIITKLLAAGKANLENNNQAKIIYNPNKDNYIFIINYSTLIMTENALLQAMGENRKAHATMVILNMITALLESVFLISNSFESMNKLTDNNKWTLDYEEE